MEAREKELRSYLKTLNKGEINNSIYLFGIDFEHDPIENIMNALYALYNDVKLTHEMIKDINENYKKNNNLYVSNKDYLEYHRKEFTLKKALSNNNVLEEFIEYYNALNNSLQKEKVR